MIRSYFIIALRNLQRNTIYTFINIAGLSVGLASSILIMLWVADELSFNKFHKHYDDLYQVYQRQELSGKIETSSSTSLPLSEMIKPKSADIKHVAIVTHPEDFSLAVDDKQVNGTVQAVTEDFLKMFSFDLTSGDQTKALSDPYSIILTATTAKAIFGDSDPLNKSIKFDNQYEMKVTGIINDIPNQSTFQFDCLIPFSFRLKTEEWIQMSQTRWGNNSFQTFVQLEPNASMHTVNSAIANIIKENNQEAPTAEVFLYPLSQIHLHSEFENGKASGGLIQYVQMFSAIAVFILIIACINFMNLATARSEGRAREVGVRKSVGSRRKQLIVQFLGESIMITLIAFIIAVVLVELTLPFFNMLVSKTLTIDYSHPGLWLGALGIVAITGIIAGSYPAFYLSAFDPAKVLKGKLHTGHRAFTPRKILVTIQFGFSIFLIAGTLIIYQQVMHVKARNIGYDRKNLLLVWSTSDIEKNYQVIREELKQSGVAKAICKSSAPITRIFSTSDGVSWPGKSSEGKEAFVTMATGYDFTETMGINMLEGRDFSPDFKSDTAAIIINEAALELMGFQKPIGQKIRVWGDDRTIIGVMENVVMGSPYHPVDPLVMAFIPDWSSTISVRLNETADLSGAIKKVETIFKKYDPGHPISYRFADAEFDSKFTSLNLISQLAWTFALLAIIISCLGLFGLAAFTAEQRTKEVGIRKVMGASVTSLVFLISRDFSKLVIVAFLIAAPMAWWMMSSFLEQYPYRIVIQWWTLLIAGVSALTIAIVIVSTQALRAATTNPVNSLRSE